MGTSVEAIICYGVLLPEKAKLPWNESEEDFGYWWLKKHGWDGDWDKSKEFEEKYPPPIDTVLHYSLDNPMYILIIPGTENAAIRGRPLALSKANIKIPTAEEIKNFKKTLAELNIPFEGEPDWQLCSFRG